MADWLGSSLYDCRRLLALGNGYRKDYDLDIKDCINGRKSVWEGAFNDISSAKGSR